MELGARRRRAIGRAALTPRMLGLLVVLLVLATGCALLGNWQLSRAQSRAENAARDSLEAENAAGAVALDSILQPQTTFPADALGRLVTVSGTWGDDLVVVPGRSVDGSPATIVLAPLRVPTADGDAILPVAIGWGDPHQIETTAAAVSASRLPTSGAVEITGYLAPSEAPDLTDEGPGAVAAIAAPQLIHRWGQPIYSAYLVAGDAAGDLSPLPEPQATTAGWNLQNLFYALEWWVFGAFALLIWVKLVRDRARLDHPELWDSSHQSVLEHLPS